MITIIVFSAISLLIYISALSTPWYYWAASSYISTVTYSYEGVLKFGWKEATYKLDSTSNTIINVTYSGDLQSTFLTTVVLLGIGGFFCLLTLVNASVYQGVGKIKKNHITFIQRFISLPLQFIFTFVCFFNFMGSFPKNAAKEPNLCGNDTEFVKQLNETTGKNNLPAFCLKTFYKTYQPFKYSDIENSIPGPGFWLTLSILAFLVIQLFVIYLVKYKVDFIHSSHSSKKHQVSNNNLNFEVNSGINNVENSHDNQIQIEMNKIPIDEPGS